MMRNLAFCSIILCLFVSNGVSAHTRSAGSSGAPPRVLVFSKTMGYRHASIAVGKLAIIKLGAENGFAVDTTEDASLFTDENLKKYAAVVFLSTTGDVLDTLQEMAFERYIESGKGYVGIHAATDTEYGWPWYGRLAGAYFLKHPSQQQATIHVVDSTDISTRHLPTTWSRFDEWYDFRDIQPGLHILLTIDQQSYKGSLMGPYHPMAWKHDFDGGRAFYTELGHTDESWSDPLYLKHVLGGIQYAIGRPIK